MFIKASPLSNQRGLSLVELIVFILIIGFFFTASIRLLRYMPSQVNAPLLDALQLKTAREVLQKTYLLNYENITLGRSEKIDSETQLTVSTSVQYAGEKFSLGKEKVKYIAVTASHKQSSPMTLSVYRFED